MIQKVRFPSGLRREESPRCLAQFTLINSAYSPVSTPQSHFNFSTWGFVSHLCLFFCHQDHTTGYSQAGRKWTSEKLKASSSERYLLAALTQLVGLCSNGRQNLSGFWTWDFTSASKERSWHLRAPNHKSCWKASRSLHIKWMAGAACLPAHTVSVSCFMVSQRAQRRTVGLLCSLAAPI